MSSREIKLSNEVRRRLEQHRAEIAELRQERREMQAELELLRDQNTRLTQALMDREDRP